MKPFDPTKPVQYRNGEIPEVLSTKGRQIISGEKYPIITEDKAGNIRTHKIDGHTSLFGGESEYDIINIPEKRKLEMWVNVYDDNGYTSHCNKHYADLLKAKRIACLHIVREYEEGEGL